MSEQNNQQFLRKVGLVVAGQTEGLDLSELRIVFRVMQEDVESPNNAAIRVYNLSDETSQRVQREYTRVILQAGYENGAYGVIFDGTIKQFRRGRENALDSYLDILAADGDVAYNFGIIAQSFAAGSTWKDHLEAAAKAMNLTIDTKYLADLTGTNPSVLSRGKVGFGMARAMARGAANSMGATWSIQNGQLQVIPLTGYLPGDAVVINSRTGMVGIPEQAEDGIRVRTLLNPKIKIGGLVQLNNKDITELTQRNPDDPVPFNQYTGIQFAAKIAQASDGKYRVYVAEHSGDTRGQDWYTDLTCLTLDVASNSVKAYG